ncbi:MAG: hypothetical protein O9972_03580 [Burkholderiales bacterium]|jgi:hypothetical protein|nr:hypothetical protein [Burkholderiales bacterium]
MKIDQTVMQFRLELANDKKWSYTDCSILVMAHRLQIFKVFAFDDHIRQMAGLGIRPLAKIFYGIMEGLSISSLNF